MTRKKKPENSSGTVGATTVRNVKPISPDRVLKKDDWLKRRKETITQLIKDLWPVGFDGTCINNHFLDEFEQAIRLINSRKTRFKKSQPKNTRGGQTRWNATRYSELLAMDASLKDDYRFKRAKRIEALAQMFCIGEKKIEEHLNKAKSRC